MPPCSDTDVDRKPREGPFESSYCYVVVVQRPIEGTVYDDSHDASYGTEALSGCRILLQGSVWFTFQNQNSESTMMCP